VYITENHVSDSALGTNNFISWNEYNFIEQALSIECVLTIEQL